MRRGFWPFGPAQGAFSVSCDAQETYLDAYFETPNFAEYVANIFQ